MNNNIMTSYDDIIKNIAQRYDLPWELVKAICHHESSFNPWAVRYEMDDPRTPQKENDYKWLYGAPDKMSFTEYVSQKIGWGIMQVQGAVAREHGFKNRFLSELLNPQIGIEYGCRHLKTLYKRYGNWPDAIAAYNQGNPAKDQTGKYINQKYVDMVMNYWRSYKER